MQTNSNLHSFDEIMDALFGKPGTPERDAFNREAKTNLDVDKYEKLLLSAAIGDIAGSAYEGRSHRTKDYNAAKMFSSRARFTDDTVLIFACAEAFIKKIDMSLICRNRWCIRH